MDGNKHYIRAENGIVVKGFTDGFLVGAGGNEELMQGDLVLEGYEQRQFQLILTTPIPRNQFKYKIVNGQMLERSQEELDIEWAGRPVPPKTAEQNKIDELTAENAAATLSIIELWEMIIPLLPE